MDIQRDDFAERAAIVDLLTDYSLEVTPAAARRIERFDLLLRPGTRVFITNLPGSDPEALIDTARRLQAEGMRPVPHLAARDIADEQVLAHLLDRLAEGRVRELLLIAGGGTRQVGPFASSMDLLRGGGFAGLGLERVWVAGHPEGHPDVDDLTLAVALREKRALLDEAGIDMHLVTQFGFDADTFLGWCSQVSEQAGPAPVHIGLAGVCSLPALIKHATQCGVGNSLNTLRKQSGLMGKLLGPTTPDRLVRALAVGALQAGLPLAPLHFFPFGGLEATVRWADSVLDGRFELDDRGGLAIAA